MVTNLYFVRHAHSTYTPEELTRPLSATGLEDAKKVQNLLVNETIHHVVSSPYLRAIQTVEGVAMSFEKEIQLVEDFKERKLTEEQAKDFDDAILKVWENPNFAWDGGESNNAAQQRGVHATKLLLDEYRGENTVIGTHGNIMVLIMNYFDSQYDFKFWRKLAMPDIYKLTFDNYKLIGCKRIWRD